jgi:hypothetical protein
MCLGFELKCWIRTHVGIWTQAFLPYVSMQSLPWLQKHKHIKITFFLLINDILLLRKFKHYTRPLRNWDAHNCSNSKVTIKQKLRLSMSNHDRNFESAYGNGWPICRLCCHLWRVKISLAASFNHIDTSINRPWCSTCYRYGHERSIVVHR